MTDVRHLLRQAHSHTLQTEFIEENKSIPSSKAGLEGVREVVTLGF